MLAFLTLVTLLGTGEALRCSGSKKHGHVINVIHNNDFHSRFDGSTQKGGECKNSEPQKCFGKISRWQRTTDTLLKESKNTLYLYGGDMFQGSLYFVKYGSEIVSNLTRRINFTAFSLGNHEFDNGVEELVNFVKDVPFPVVCSNLDASKEPELEKLVKKYVIREVQGVKIGIVGFLTPEVMAISRAEKAVFTDEVEAIREQARALKQDHGVNLVFAVGHSGIGIDKKIAAEVEEVDLVVGGHTNTFLYNGEPPAGITLVPEGPYPIMVNQSSGKVVPVVQAYAYGVFLGNLSLTFSKDFKLLSAVGQPILMDQKWPLDEDLQKKVDLANKDLEVFKKDVIGYTTIELEGGKQPCRLRECTMGNHLADTLQIFSMRKFDAEYSLGSQWNGYPITLINGGAFKQSIKPGNVTRADVLGALPYPNDLCVVNITGEILLQILQRSISQIIGNDPEGRYIQLSGVYVVFDGSRPQGDRLVSVKVRCRECTVPSYYDIDVSSHYLIITTDYIASGSDGFDMLKGIPYINTGFRLVDIYMSSFENSPPLVELTNRSSIVKLNREMQELKYNGELSIALNK